MWAEQNSLVVLTYSVAKISKSLQPSGYLGMSR